jgi:hypothetical protein
VNVAFETLSASKQHVAARHEDDFFSRQLEGFSLFGRLYRKAQDPQSEELAPYQDVPFQRPQ